MGAHVAAFDTIVIGAGSGGAACAYALAAGGQRVAIVERERVGGECAFWACVPSKVLLRSATPNAQSATAPGSKAARAGDPVFAEAAAWRTAMVDNYDDSDHAEAMRDAGVTLVRGTAMIVAPGRVRIGEADFQTATIVIASGSTDKLPKLDGLTPGRPFWTTRDATSAGAVPQSLTIMGGGAAGVELAQIFARYGTKVALIEAGPQLLPEEEPAAAACAEAFLTRDGVDVRTECKPVRVAWQDGSHTLTLEDGSALTAERLCVSTGRIARTDGLGLAAAGVTPNAKGSIPVDATCRAADGIYAVGDVTGEALLTHIAKYQGRIAAANILGSHAQARYDAIPRCVYTNPEIAATGITRKRAAERGTTLLSAHVAFDEITRPTLYSEPPAVGAVELFADAATRTIAGGWIAGPHASEMLGFITSAIVAATPLATLLDVIQPYPTFSEALYVACDRLARM